jgi:hypothetical protein
MLDAELRNLTIHVSNATKDYHRAVTEGAPVNIVLERIWLLQDWLGRLLDATSDRPCDAKLVLESLRSRVSEAVDSGFAKRGPFPVTVPAVSRSRAMIQEHLAELERLNGGPVLAHAAGA